MQPQARPVTINGVAYPSQAAAARELGVTEHRIRAWVAQHGDTFAVDDIASYRPQRRHVVAVATERVGGRARPVEIDGVRYASMADAARALGVTRQAISLQVSKKQGVTTMEKIILEQFGPVTRFDAAHIVDASGRISAYIAEPEARNGEGGQTKDWDEAAFRAAVESEVASWEPRNAGERVWVQYDPGRDNALSVEVELRG